MTEAWIAVVSATIGGVGVKLVEVFASRPAREFEQATAIREELRLELATVRGEMTRYSIELDQWREKYFSLLAEHVKLKELYVRLEHEVTSMRDGMRQS